jgi:hypothetical protein
MHRLQYYYDVYVASGEGRYTFTEADHTAYAEPAALTGLIETVLGDTLTRALQVRLAKPTTPLA